MERENNEFQEMEQPTTSPVDITDNTENTESEELSERERAEMKRKRKNTRWIAKIISFVFFPLLMPIYATFLLFNMKLFTYYPTPYVTEAKRTIFLFGIVLPCVSFIILKVFKAISDLRLPRKEERVIPYLSIAFCYLCCAYLLLRAAMPLWVVNLVISVAFVISVESIISKYWRISGHASSMGMLVGSIAVSGYCTYTNVCPMICYFLLLTGIVGCARMYLNRHTSEQLMAGFVFGAASMVLMEFLNPAQLLRLI